MCFSFSKISQSSRWNWDGERIVHDSIVPSSRPPVGHKDGNYDIDVREFLVNERNVVMRRTLEVDIKKFISKLPNASWDLFRSRDSGSFDLRAQIISEFVSRKIEYLQSDPTWARKSQATLIKELGDAFVKKDLKAIENLAKKGDFWIGQIFSEFEIVRFSQVKPYFSTYLPQSHLQVHPAEKKENEYVLKITSWGDPEFSILYLYIEKGIYGWEWSKIVLSNPEIECQVNNFDDT